LLFEKLIFDGFKPDAKGGVSCGHKLQRGLLLKENKLVSVSFFTKRGLLNAKKGTKVRVRNNNGLAGYSRQPVL